MYMYMLQVTCSKWDQTNIYMSLDVATAFNPLGRDEFTFALHYRVSKIRSCSDSVFYLFVAKYGI